MGSKGLQEALEIIKCTILKSLLKQRRNGRRQMIGITGNGKLLLYDVWK